MNDASKIKLITSSSITQGALTIALVVVFFLLFKGITNILNALVVPITLFIFSINKKHIESFLVYLALIFVCAIFFNMQLIFAIFYCAISFIIKVLFQKNINIILSAIILFITNAVTFWVAIMLTDLIFLTRMGYIMLQLVNGDILIYALILTGEGILVGVGQLLLSKKIIKLIGKSARHFS